MNNKYNLSKSDFGYFEVIPKPSIDELSTFYADQYYQNPPITYKSSYPLEELQYYNNLAKTAHHIFNERKFVKNSLLDIGCGEGYFARYFHQQGWHVACADFSSHGIDRHNPKLIDNFYKGDIHDTLLKLINKENKFGFLNMQNVLEHVLDPLAIIKRAYDVLENNGILRIRVPNDYSNFQKMLTDSNFTKNTWFVPPEHINYFNVESFKEFINHTEFKILSLQLDFPIELFLINNNSNYWADRAKGYEAHKTRLYVENYLMEKSTDNYIKYCECAANLDFGREIVAYLIK